jgi:putative mycofactocin binding protein MftB
MVELTEILQLSPSVALRPEPFGALAYHFGNRRLTFLKRPELVQVISCLNGTDLLKDVLQKCEIPEPKWDVYTEAIASLIEADMIHSLTQGETSQKEHHND